MNWSTFHKKSERFASEAEVAMHKGDVEAAKSLYEKAAEAEESSLKYLDPSTKPRTLGICVVSSAALWYKANQVSKAERFISDWLKEGNLPEFAKKDLKSLLREIKKTSQDKGHQQETIHRSIPRRSMPKPFPGRLNRPKMLA